MTDDILDRHAAKGVIMADQHRRGDGHLSEVAAITQIIANSHRMARADGFSDKGLIGFLALGAICAFRIRLMETAGGAQ